MGLCEEYPILGLKHIIKKINIDDLIDKLSGFESLLVFIGGAWDKLTSELIKKVNDISIKAGLSEVYNYDPLFINVFKEEENLIDCKTLENKLKYYSIIERIGYKSNELVQDTLIPKIHVPFFIAMKNGSCIGTYQATYSKLNDFESDFKALVDQIPNK